MSVGVSFRCIAALLLLWTVGSSLSAFPHFFTYFNEFAGGHTNGRKHLLHSSLDWGQGLLLLDEQVEAHPEWRQLGIVYAGPISPQEIGMRARTINWSDNSPLRNLTHVAISANCLEGEFDLAKGVDAESAAHQKLLECCRKARPVAYTDGSILVFELASIGMEAAETRALNSSVSKTIPALPPSLPPSFPPYCSRVESLSGLVHTLILHGFGDTGLSGLGQPRSGLEAFRILTDERFAKAFFGESPFIRTRNGVRYKLIGKKGGDGGKRGESHRDQCLSTFATLRLPESTAIVLEKEKLSIGDLITESVANFTFEQGEINWTAIAYAHYLPPDRQWTDRFGRSTTFSELTRHLMKTGFKNQSCGGVHVLQAVVAIQKADAEFGILDRETRIECREFLNDAFRKVLTSQGPDGAWSHSWHSSDVDERKKNTGSIKSRIIVTGHMLELLHECDREITAEVFVEPTIWLAEALRSDLIGGIDVCPLTHALRSVRLSKKFRVRFFKLD